MKTFYRVLAGWMIALAIVLAGCLDWLVTQALRLRERYAGRRGVRGFAALALLALAFEMALWFGTGGVLLGLMGMPLLMALSFYTDLPQYSFKQNVADALVGKEGYPLELVAGTLNVQLLNAGIYIGDMFERLEGSQAVMVNLRGPIKKAIANGALNSPAYVKMAANGLVAANSADKAHGIVIFPEVCAAGDQVSYIKFDCVMP